MIKIVELTKDNEEKYLDQIVELEQISLEAMKKEGREGQLFDTGREGISEYVHSNENSVIVATDENDKVEAATYVTQGQSPFTYNDITKYFKYGEKYKQYVKSQYLSDRDYKKDLRNIYIIKIKAFEYAKRRILRQSGRSTENSLYGYLQQELEQNEYHEKSELREKVNQYMAEYISSKFNSNIQNKYEQFYWITADDISQEFGKSIKSPNIQVKEYEEYMEYQKEYEEILDKAGLKIYESPMFDETQYYTSNTKNTIELDTYITNPNSRNVGSARIIVYEGIKKHMEKFFSCPKNKEIFLCSTLHRDNLSSKYVSEFFGLKDSLYVNRRQGRDREVHICKIDREQAMEYLTHMSDRLAVLYGYNPNNKHISQAVRKSILQEQLNYEEQERKRLVKARATDKKFKGINFRFIREKEHKIGKLKQQLEEIKCAENEGEIKNGE